MSLENDEEWSNDSDIYIEDADSDVTDTKSEIKSNVRSKLGNDDSYLYITVSFDQTCKQDTSKQASYEIYGRKVNIPFPVSRNTIYIYRTEC